MQRFITFLLFTLFLVFCFSQKQAQDEPAYLPGYLAADRLFNEAALLPFQHNYNEEKESKLNLQSLHLFRQVLPAIVKDGNDSLAFFCHFKIATLFHYFDSLASAKNYYQEAIKLKTKLPGLADSLLFKPLLFTGSVYYSLNEFDSAFLFYKKAEQVSDRYSSPLSEQQRLYNRLGAVSYTHLDVYKRQDIGGFTYDYDNLSILHAFGGWHYMPCPKGNIELEAGPALGIFKVGSSEFGYGVSLNGYLQFTPPARTIYKIAEQGKKSSSWSLSAGIDYYKLGKADGIFLINGGVRASF